VEKMVEEAFVTCLSRLPDATEQEIAAQLYQEQLAYFQKHPADAAALLKVGQSPSDASVPPPRPLQPPSSPKRCSTTTAPS
jgi:hypothetical protein